MSELLRSYNSPLLRNFEVQELNGFLPEYISEYTRKIRSLPTSGSGWEKIAAVLNENKKENTESDQNIDSILFEKLFYNLQDHIHFYYMSSEINADEFISRFEGKAELNRPINATVPLGEKFISIRQEANKVLILYRFETIKLGSSEQKANFYIPCLLDFDRSLLQIRLRKHYISKSSANHNEVLEEVKGFMNDLDGDISIQSFNETEIHKLVYYIFKEESEKAEGIIKEHMSERLSEEAVNKKIITFLNEELEMSDPELYSDRVKSAFYQDLSLQLDPSTFYNGFIFAFTFLDKNFIKSSTRNPKRDPIYNARVYWNLKDLIHEYQEVSELSCYWKFKREDFTEAPQVENFEFVEISLRERNGSLEIHYYNSPSQKRRLKEEYVYFRISKYLFSETLSE